jgi:choice-of-anchor A domain-containing protein
MNNVAINATNVDSSGIAVFNTTSSILSKYASFNVNMGSAKTVIFNVTGNYSQSANFQDYNDNTVDSHVIWNFVDATSVSLQAFGGTVLAENATVTNSSPIDGDLVAASYTGNGELHDHPFAGVLPSASPAPLPPLGGSIASLLGIVGFTALGIRRRRAA